MQTHAVTSSSVQHMRVGVTFRYNNLRFASVPAPNCKLSLDKRPFILSPHWKHFTTFTSMSWVLTVEVSADWGFSGGDWLKMEECPSDQSRTSARGEWNPHSCVESTHALWAPHVMTQSSRVSQWAHLCHFSTHRFAVFFFLTTEGRQRSWLYVHVMNINAAHSEFTVRIMAQAEACKINQRIFLLLFGGRGCDRAHRASGWPQKLLQKGYSPPYVTPSWHLTNALVFDDSMSRTGTLVTGTFSTVLYFGLFILI